MKMDNIEIFNAFERPKTIVFMIPVNQASALTSVANEFESIILIDKEVFEYAGSRWRKVFVSINCYTDLFALGLQTGLKLFETIAVSPLKQVMDTLQNKLDNFKEEKND